MSFAPYLTLISEVLPVERRDFYAADPTILNPNATNPLLDGEWMSIDSSYKAARGSGNQAVPTWQVFAERGRYDTQAIGKVPFLFIGGYEAETTICTLTGIGIGDALIVGDVTVSGQTKQGLIKCPASSGTYLVVGFATRLPGSGKLRYWKPGSPTFKTV